MVSCRVHLKMNFKGLTQSLSLYLPLWHVKCMNVVLIWWSEYILPLPSIPYFYHLSMPCLSVFLPFCALYHSLQHLFFLRRTILLYFTCVHTYKDLAFIRRGKKKLQQCTWTVGESLWPTRCSVFSWSTFSIESQKQMF